MTGQDAGSLEWHSRAGGEWMCFVASPGWQTRNASGYSNLVLHVNGPSPVPAASLPRIGLESGTNIRTPHVPLGDLLATGLDGDPDSWQQIIIPLDAFQPYGGFQLAQFKAVFFRQGTADDNPRTVWHRFMREPIIQRGFQRVRPAQLVGATA